MAGHTVEARKERWRTMLKADAAPGMLYRIDYSPDAQTRPNPWPDNVQGRINWAAEKYEKSLERSEWLDEDTVPYLDIFTGTEIFAEAFGSNVYRAEGEMPFALPAVSSAEEAKELQIPDIDRTPLAVLFEIADALRGQYGPKAVVKLPDIQSPMDIAALICDKNQFYIDLIMQPDAVKELSEKVKTLLIAFLDTWFDRYGTSYVAHYPAYYMEGGLTLSEDEVGAVNSEMYDEFFLPELIELSEHFGGMGVHCCADARHQWNGFLQIPGLSVLNLVQPVDVIREAGEFFKDRCLQYHQPQTQRGGGRYWADADEFPAGSRIVVEAVAETRDEALAESERLCRMAGR